MRDKIALMSRLIEPLMLQWRRRKRLQSCVGLWVIIPQQPRHRPTHLFPSLLSLFLSFTFLVSSTCRSFPIHLPFLSRPTVKVYIAISYMKKRCVATSLLSWCILNTTSKYNWRRARGGLTHGSLLRGWVRSGRVESDFFAFLWVGLSFLGVVWNAWSQKLT